MLIASIAILLTPVNVLAQNYTIHAGKLIDTRAGKVLEQQTIRVSDNKIVAVESGFQPPGINGELIDLSDKTVMPGLMDMHTHLTGELSKTSYGEGFYMEPTDYALRAVGYSEKTLYGWLHDGEKLG